MQGTREVNEVVKTMLQNGFCGISKDISNTNIRDISENGIYFGSNVTNAPNENLHLFQIFVVTGQDRIIKAIDFNTIVAGKQKSVECRMIKGIWSEWVLSATSQAKDIDITDEGNHFTSNKVEGAMQELASSLKDVKTLLTGSTSSQIESINSIINQLN